MRNRKRMRMRFGGGPSAALRDRPSAALRDRPLIETGQTTTLFTIAQKAKDRFS